VAASEARWLVAKRGFGPKATRLSANGAKYDSQGQARSASPLVTKSATGKGLKGRNT